MKEKKEILYTSDKLVKYVKNIEGWVDVNGRFWGKDEHAARWSGCTHIICPDCGKPTSKNYTICSDCREKKAIERYNEKERIIWDGEIPLYSASADEYFFDADEILDYMEEANCNVESLRFLICDPVKLGNIDSDYWEDQLADGGDLPNEVLKAINELNELINDQPPVSWYPGKLAAIVNLT